jgi:hypothetical protein
MYATFLPHYEARISKQALFDINMVVTKDAENTFRVNITASRRYNYANNMLKLRLALTESHIPKNWQSNMKEVNFVCRKMYPHALGTILNFADTSQITESFTVVTDTAWNVNHCEVVAFLQDDQTFEVLQCRKAALIKSDSIPVMATDVSIWPNPATDKVTIQCMENIQQLILFDAAGREVRNLSMDQKGYVLNTATLSHGAYLIRIVGPSGKTDKKLILY